MPVISWFRTPGLLTGEKNFVLEKLNQCVKKAVVIKSLETELCFYIDVDEAISGKFFQK